MIRKPIVQTHRETYHTSEIVLCQDEAGYWGWIVRGEIHLPYTPHFNVARDHARKHINPNYPYHAPWEL